MICLWISGNFDFCASPTRVSPSGSSLRRLIIVWQIEEIRMECCSTNDAIALLSEKTSSSSRCTPPTIPPRPSFVVSEEHALLADSFLRVGYHRTHLTISDYFFRPFRVVLVLTLWLLWWWLANGIEKKIQSF